MMEKFHRLSHREQFILAAGSALALACLLYLLVWQPLNRSLRAERAEYATAVRTLAEVSSAASRIRELQQARPDSGPSNNLTALVNESLRARQLEFTRLQQLDANQVQIRLDGIAFAETLAWLYGLESTPGLVVSDLIIRPAGTGQPGQVNVTVGLSRLN